MSDLDDFFTDTRETRIEPPAPVAPAPLRAVANTFRARLEAVMANIPEDHPDDQPTYTCKYCKDDLYLRHATGVWMCTNCPSGWAILVKHWLDVCFPIEPRLDKRLPSARGQQEFDRYAAAYPELEWRLKEAINKRKMQDVADRNRSRQEQKPSW